MDVRSPASQLPTALSTSAGGASSSSSEEGRFVPGTLLGDRYRIISLLGVGGMGEVYRATDLRLSQQVALKFLPAEVARDPKFLARFNNEVRIARQVSHPKVFRPVFHGHLISSREQPVVGKGRTIAFGVREGLFRGAQQMSPTRVMRQLDA